MNSLKIKIGDDIITSHATSNSVTTFYIVYQGTCFPDDHWTDITDSVLGIWTTHMLRNIGDSENKFTLPFMDGPYRLDVVKDRDMQLIINCICFRHEDCIQYTIHCGYVDFLSALHQAFNDFNYILHKNGMNKGKYENVYNQTIISMRELKEAITLLSSK